MLDKLGCTDTFIPNSKENKNIIITSGIKVLSESHFPIIGKFFASEIVEIKIKQ